MTKNNLKLLDMDEELREMLEHLHASHILACRVLGLTPDLATSDIAMFVVNDKNESICLSD